MKGALSSVGAIIGYIVLAGILVAIMVIYNWDPIAFISTTVNRISEVFLGWDWFRSLVGAGVISNLP